MSASRDRCPACGHRLITTRFDTTFRLPDRSERLCFGIPGGLCEDCSQLYIDPDLIELLELGDRLADGTALPAAARAMGISSEFRARTLATQAKRWTTDELAAALADLVEVDAMVKGVPGSGTDAAQRRLAFTMWVRTHATAGPGPGQGSGGRVDRSA